MTCWPLWYQRARNRGGFAGLFVGSQALGKVEIGQKVVIKLDGFPYLEYGTLEGQVSSVALVPVEGKYLVEIDLPDGTTTTYGREPAPGTADGLALAEIITSERRLLYKLVGASGKGRAGDISGLA